MSELSDAILKGVQNVAKNWKAAKRHADKEDRLSQLQYDRLNEKPHKVTVRNAAFEVMEFAYNQASSNGKFIAHARQIMYAARPLIIELTGKTKPWTSDSYFTQDLLKDYLEEYRPDWKIVWDARGHMREPHTGKVIGLGGIEVERYINQWSSKIEITRPDVKTLIRTLGPGNRFKYALFIEKEGFTEILTHARIPERFDMALLSTKGIPVKAACELISALEKKGVKVFVLRDFDKQGFTIVKSLREGVRLSEGSNVIDLGLRLQDVEDLESEPVEYEQDLNPRFYLEECGATPEEQEFLVSEEHLHHYSGRRVEINAMTSEQLITWLERKFEEHGVEKFIPDLESLETSYRRAEYLSQLQEIIDEVELPDNNEPVPDNIMESIKEILEDDPTLSWDEAIWELHDRHNLSG